MSSEIAAMAEESKRKCSCPCIDSSAMIALTTATSSFSQCTCTSCGPQTAARDGSRRCTVQVDQLKFLIFGILLCGECMHHHEAQQTTSMKKRKNDDADADSENNDEDDRRTQSKKAKAMSPEPVSM